jgi:hypothetical protein
LFIVFPFLLNTRDKYLNKKIYHDNKELTINKKDMQEFEEEKIDGMKRER